MQTAVAHFFGLPIFIFLGAVLPWREWVELGWSGILLALAMLGLRRLLASFLIGPLLGSVGSARETAFNGWFGPLGGHGC